ESDLFNHSHRLLVVLVPFIRFRKGGYVASTETRTIGDRAGLVAGAGGFFSFDGLEVCG
ncbi:UNVERIFIED_CONTAM: hypothetical protein Sindi_3065600, partial [Sesamum indicum]